MTDDDWQPMRRRMVDSADALKAMADPIRLRILQLLMGTSERSWSVKEIAADLEQPVTKLYHHVKLLEAAELITDVESRLVSGIVEHRYRASQRGLEFDDALLFKSPQTRHDSIVQIATLVDANRDDLIDYLSGDSADIDQVMVAKHTTRLTPAEIKAVMKAIEDLMETYSGTRDDESRSGLPRSSMLFVMNPLAHDVP